MLGATDRHHSNDSDALAYPGDTLGMGYRMGYRDWEDRMSASRLVTIFCDAPHCGVWDGAGVADTAREARAGLRGGGWILALSDPDHRLALDYCPKHAHLAP